jgi:hypothetical protein
MAQYCEFLQCRKLQTDYLLPMKPACPIPGNFTASQTLYQNRLPRFYGDLWGVLICLQHPGRRASLVFRPLLLRGGWSLSAGFNPAHHRVLYIPLAFATWACGCITRGARHNPPSQCHTWLAVFPSALPTKALAIVRSTVGVRQTKSPCCCIRSKPPGTPRGGCMSKGSKTVGFDANGADYRSVL